MPHRSPFLQHLCKRLQHLGKSKPLVGTCAVCQKQRLWVAHESCQPWEQANFYTLGPLGGIELAQHWPGEIWRQRLTCWPPTSPTARAFSQVSAANLAVASCVLVPFLRAKSLKIHSITLIVYSHAQLLISANLECTRSYQDIELVSLNCKTKNHKHQQPHCAAFCRHSKWDFSLAAVSLADNIGKL